MNTLYVFIAGVLLAVIFPSYFTMLIYLACVISIATNKILKAISNNEENDDEDLPEVIVTADGVRYDKN